MTVIYPILKHIANNPDTKVSDLEYICVYRTAEERCGWLVDDGLIEYHIKPRGRRCFYYNITPKGRAELALMQILEHIHTYGIEDYQYEDVKDKVVDVANMLSVHSALEK